MKIGKIEITPFFRWFDIWIGIYISWPDRYTKGLRIYICLLPTIGIKIDLSETELWLHYIYGYPDDDYDEELSEHWLCACGNYITNGLHCPECKMEPPWGCPCSWCDGDRYFEEELDAYLYHPGPWDD